MAPPSTAHGGVARHDRTVGVRPDLTPRHNPNAHPTKLAAVTARSALTLAATTDQPVEITSERTPVSSTLANPDGTYSLESYSSPVRVRRNGAWLDLDTSLVNDGLAVVPRSTVTPMRLSPGGSADLVRYAAAGGSISVGWPTALPTPQLSGSTARYVGVRPGVDLEVTADANGFDTQIVLTRRPSAPLSFMIPIQTRNLTAKVDSAGALGFANDVGNLVVDGTTPTMHDSAIDAHSGEPIHTANVNVNLDRKASGAVLKIRPSAQFLQDPDVKYPVTIDGDPNLSKYAYDYVESSFPTNTHWNNTTSDTQNGKTYKGITKTGTFNSGGDKFEAFYIFPTSSIGGKKINSTSMKFFQYWGWSCTAATVNLYSTATTFGSGLNWNNKPNKGTFLDGETAQHGWSTTSCPAAYTSFSSAAMNTYTQNIANAGTNYAYVGLWAGSETSNTYWRKFTGANATFTVNYESYPGAPTGLSPANGATVGSLTPTLQATVSDVDTGATINGKFTLVDHTTGATILNAVAGSSFTTTSSAHSGTTKKTTPALTNGHVFYWKVQSATSTGLLGPTTPSTGWYSFTVLCCRIPGPPGNVTATPGNNQVVLDWDPPADDGGSPITSYTVYKYDPAENAQCPLPPPTTGITKTYTGVSGTTKTISTPDVVNGHSYCFAVAAVNALGTGAKAGHTPSVEPHGALQVLKVAQDANLAQPVWDAGQAPVFTVTYTNPEAAGTMRGVTLTDELPPDLAADVSTDEIHLSGTSLPVNTTCADLGAACGFINTNDANELDIQRDIPAGQSVTVSYAASLPASTAAVCQTLTNTASYTWGDNVSSPVVQVPINLPTCDPYLGLEPWWSTVDTAVGDASDAHVNVADGNLVVTATDGLPVQTHGRLGLVVRRTYNSQESTIATLPGSLGAGWRLNIAQTDALAGDVATTDALYVPSFESITHPFDLTLIDRDGTRHLFTANPAATTVTGTNLAPLALPVPSATSGLTVCVDQTYTPPPGVHLALWRYVQTSATCTGTLTKGNTKLIGYVAERPDRVRYEYAADGHLVAMFDGAGNQLRYLYGTTPADATIPVAVDTTQVPIPTLGKLQAVLPASNSSCLVGGSVPTTLSALPASCPALRFYYFNGETDVYDSTTYPGDTRSLGPTRYYMTGSGLTAQLSQVIAADDPANIAANNAAGYGVASSMTPGSPAGLTDRTTYTYCGSPAQLCEIDVSSRTADTSSAGYGQQKTKFTYLTSGLPANQPAPIASVQNRRQTTTTFGYDNPALPTQTTTTTGNEVNTYSQIDDSGRVARLDEGTSTTALRTTMFGWDGAVNTTNPYSSPASQYQVGTCEQPAGPAQDNNLCRVQRLALTPDTSTDPDAAQQDDSESSYIYNDTGDLLIARRCVDEHTVTSSAVTGAQGTHYAAGWQDSCPHGSSSPYTEVTHGIHLQYFGTFTPSSGSSNWTNGSVLTTDDAPDGNGGVTSGDRPQPTDTVLFAISDATVDVPARGNATGSTTAAAAYETKYVQDYPANNAAGYPGPNPTSQAAACGTNAGSPTGQPTGNTGLTCETDAPSYHGATAPDTTTRYAYDNFGQRSAMLTPNQVAGVDNTCAENATPAAPNPASTPYKYSYYADTDLDAETPISGSSAGISAGGWLKAITDPCQKSVVFQYDRAGHVIHTWDRTATRGYDPSAWTGNTFPTPAPPAPPLPKADDSYQPNSGTASSATAATSPWRYKTSSSDALSHATTVAVDLAGNPVRVTSPLGHATISDYDLSSELVNRRTPAEPASAASRYGYDTFGNLNTVTDPNGHVTAITYDAVNRQQRRYFSRSASDANHPTPVGCDVTGATQPGPGQNYSDANNDPGTLPTNRIACFTQSSYDGLDRVTGSRDGSGATGHTDFDSLSRPIRTITYRDATTKLTALSIYDVDDHVILSCPPRQQAEQSGACVPAATAPAVGSTFCSATIANPAHYATLMEYDYAGRLCHRQTYREHDAAASPSWDVLDSTIHYDADGNPTATTDPRGKTAQSAYDALDQQVSTTRPRAGTAFYQYDDSGDRTGVVEPGPNGSNSGVAGQGTGWRITGFTYDADHRLIDTIHALQVSSTDPPHDPGAITTAAGLAPTDAAQQTNLRSRIEYDSDGNVISRADPRAFAASLNNPATKYFTRTTYDADARATAVYSPRYDTSDSSTNDPNADSVQSGQCAANAAPTGFYASTVGVCITRYAYDAVGNTTVKTLGTSSIQDPTAATLSDNKYVDYTYTDDNLIDTNGSPNPDTSASNNRATTRYGYDGVGRATKITNPAQQTTTTTYNYDGTVAETRSPDGPNSLSHLTDMTYNAAGQLTTSVIPRTVVCTTNGTSASATERAPATTTYYADGLAKSITTPAAASADPNSCTWTSSVRKYTYDPNGNTASSTDPNTSAVPAGTHARPTTYTYTDDNLVQTINQPVIVGTAADGSQDQARLTTYSYDIVGRKTAEQADYTGVNAAQGGKLTFDYYPDDLLRTENGRGTVGGTSDPASHVDYTYDAAGEPTTIISTQPAAAGLGGFPSGPAVDTFTASYYLDGATRTTASSAGTPATLGGAQETSNSSYSYNGDGTPTTRTVNSAATTIGTNDAGAVSSVHDSRASGTGTTQFTYNALGQLKERDDPNGDQLLDNYNASDGTLASTVVKDGSSSHATIESTSYTYDERFRVIQQSFWGTSATQTPIGSSSAPINYGYAYDPGGRLSKFSDPAGTRTITYDLNGNRTDYGLTGEPNPQHWTYRADDSIDQATSQGTSRTYAYAPFGGLTDDGCTTYSYDAFDRLFTTSGRTATGCAPATSNAYNYDALGRQAQDTQRNSLNTVTSDTIVGYAGDSAAIANEHDRTASTNVAYVLDGAGSPIATVKNPGASATVNYLVDDGQDNVATITTSAATNNVACTARYDGYGSPDGNTAAFSLAPTGSCNTGLAFSDIFYRMNRKDGSTGNYQAGARTYDPSKASFLTPDSANAPTMPSALSIGVDPLTQNRYSYVNGDPVNFDDPTGHMRVADDGGAAAACDTQCQVTLRKHGENPWDTGAYTPAATTPPVRHEDSHCGVFNVSCHVSHAYHAATRAASAVGSTVVSASVDVYDTSVDTFDAAKSVVSSAAGGASDLLDATANRFVRGVKDLAAAGATVVHDVESAGSTTVHAVGHAAADFGHGVTTVAKATGRGIATAAKATGHAVVSTVRYCLGRGASTCAAAAGAVALAATGVGLIADAALVADIGATALGASRALSVVSFARTGNPLDALGALPGVGALREGAGALRTAEETTQAVRAAEEAGGAETYVYRVHGGDSGPMGHSWTPENPMGMANPRNELGLPKGNSGQMLTRARVTNMDGVMQREALPLDGNEGGAPEWLFPDPENQLEVHWTIPLVPPW
jgi:RHS repeat-associated protein